MSFGTSSKVPSVSSQQQNTTGGWESHIPKDKETEIVSKSNWREEQTKIRTIDVDPGVGGNPPCSECKDTNAEMKMMILGKRKMICLFRLRHSPSIDLFAIPSL